MTDQVPILLEKLAAIAQAGLAYTADRYDRERFEQLRALAGELVEALDGSRAGVEWLFGDDDGYRTPKIDVRGVVLRGDRVLLVRERHDGLWTLPGGWADIGETPAESVEREVYEESGYKARTVRLLALYDRRRHDHGPCPWHVYKAFFQCEVEGDPASVTAETDGSGFFALDELPPLSVARVTPTQLRTLVGRVRSGEQGALYD